ncbi:MAG TPA: DUF3761 domain-containing protein [Solirubrobacteraceae bacterium]
MGKLGSRAMLFGAVMVVAAMLSGCGSSGTNTTNITSASATIQAAPKAKVVPVALHLGRGSYSVSAPGTTISGTASKGALISVNGTKAIVHAGRWHDSLHLHIGSNQVEVEATMSGRSPTTRVIHIVRHHSATELEALAHARALRAEAKRQHETEAREHKEQEAAAKREHEQTTQQAECPNGTYENSAGNIVCKPYESSTQPAGATAECEDGTYSFSESRSGTCSHHGGVKEWLNG